jgi:hypothetical protein
MNRFVCLILFAFLPIINTNSQNSTAYIDDVDYNVISKKIVVTYKIIKYSPIENFTISLKFVNEKNDTLSSVSMKGDVGKNIKGFGSKKIIWDFIKDDVKIKGSSLKAIVTIVSVSENPGGPTNAFLSLIIPGLGDRYVYNSGKSIIKPYFETIVVYSSVGFGVYEKFQKDAYYDKYLKAIKKTDIDNYYNQANSANHNFILFTAAGAAIWAADIAWVAWKGYNNKLKSKNFKAYISPSFSPDKQLALTLKIGF